MDDVDNLAGELLDFAKSLIPREPGESYDAWMKRAESLAGAIVEMNSEAQLPENWWDDAKAKYPRESTESYDQWQDRARGLAQAELNGDVIGLAKSLAEGQKRVQDSNEPWKEVGNIVDALKKSLGTYEWSTMTCDEQNALIDAVSKQIQKDFFEGQAALAAALDALKNPTAAPTPSSTTDNSIPKGPIKVSDQTGIKEYGDTKTIADANKLHTEIARSHDDSNLEGLEAGPMLKATPHTGSPIIETHGLNDLLASDSGTARGNNLAPIGEDIQPVGGTAEAANVDTSKFHKATISQIDPALSQGSKTTTPSSSHIGTGAGSGSSTGTEIAKTGAGSQSGTGNTGSPSVYGAPPQSSSADTLGHGAHSTTSPSSHQSIGNGSIDKYDSQTTLNSDSQGIVGGFGVFTGGIQNQQPAPQSLNKIGAGPLGVPVGGAVTDNSNLNNNSSSAGYKAPAIGTIGNVLPQGELPNIYLPNNNGEFQLDNQLGSTAVKQAFTVMGQLPGTQQSLDWSQSQAYGAQCSNCHYTAQSIVTGQDLHTTSADAAKSATGGFGQGNIATATDMANHGWVQTPVNWDTMSQIDHIGSVTFNAGGNTSHSATVIHEGQNSAILERSGAGFSPTLINKTDFANVHLVDAHNNPITPQQALTNGEMKVYVPDTKTQQIEDPIARAGQQEAIMEHAKQTDMGQQGAILSDTLKSVGADLLTGSLFTSGNYQAGLQEIGNNISNAVSNAAGAGLNYLNETKDAVSHNQMSPFGEQAAASDELWENKLPSLSNQSATIVHSGNVETNVVNAGQYDKLIPSFDAGANQEPVLANKATYSDGQLHIDNVPNSGQQQTPSGGTPGSHEKTAVEQLNEFIAPVKDFLAPLDKPIPTSLKDDTLLGSIVGVGQALKATFVDPAEQVLQIGAEASDLADKKGINVVDAHAQVLADHAAQITVKQIVPTLQATGDLINKTVFNQNTDAKQLVDSFGKVAQTVTNQIQSDYSKMSPAEAAHNFMNNAAQMISPPEGKAANLLSEAPTPKVAPHIPDAPQISGAATIVHSTFEPAAPSNETLRNLFSDQSTISQGSTTAPGSTAPLIGQLSKEQRIDNLIGRAPVSADPAVEHKINQVINDVKGTFNSVPEHVFNFIESKAGGQPVIIVGRTLPEVLTDLVGQQPRGYPAGSTWNQVDGVKTEVPAAWQAGMTSKEAAAVSGALPSRSVAVISTHLEHGGVLVESNRAAALAKHEFFGHVLKEQSGVFSDSKDFMTAYNRDNSMLLSASWGSNPAAARQVLQSDAYKYVTQQSGGGSFASPAGVPTSPDDPFGITLPPTTPVNQVAGASEAHAEITARQLGGSAGGATFDKMIDYAFPNTKIVVNEWFNSLGKTDLNQQPLNVNPFGRIENPASSAVPSTALSNNPATANPQTAPRSGVKLVNFAARKSGTPAKQMHQRAASSWFNKDDHPEMSNDSEPVYLALANPQVIQSTVEDTVSENAVAGLLAGTDSAYDVTLTNGTVYCPKGSCVFIRDRGRDVGIYVFENSARGDVVYKGRNGHFTSLKPGRFLIVTSGHDITAADANPVSIFGLRGIEEIPLGNEYKAYVGDFSIFAACAELPHIRNMLKSKNSAERRMAHGILKNVAILGQITAMDGPFKQMR